MYCFVTPVNLIYIVLYIYIYIYIYSDKVYQQIPGTAIGTKFASPYACMFMDQVESKFLQTQKF